MTTPIPWSMKKPLPIRAAGWISMPVTDRATVAISRGTIGTPAPYRAWATRWASSAWTPGQAARISSEPTSRAAGSRSWAAAISRRISATVRAMTPRPNMAQRLATGRRQSAAAAPPTARLGSEERRRDVALAGVRQHDGQTGATTFRAVRHLESGPHRRATGDPGQDSLPPGQQPCRLDGVLVIDGDDLVEDLAVEHRGYEPGADALDLVRPGPATGQDGRVLRLHRDDPAIRIARLEHLAGAGDRPAGPDSGDQSVDAPV